MVMDKSILIKKNKQVHAALWVSGATFLIYKTNFFK